MLLMSLRCYINCVVPTTEKQILLNSRYFVLDIADGRYDSGDFFYDTNNGALGRYKQNIDHCKLLFHRPNDEHLNLPHKSYPHHSEI